MNKKLLTVAVGAVLSAGAMVAVQADTTVYGHFHLSYDRADNDVQKESVMSNNSSRFGIKGDEDLGGGMKAIYQIESGIFNVDDGAGGLGATLRNTFMGLSSAWGAVKLGRHDTPTKDLNRAIDRFNEQIGDARNLVGNKGNFDSRVSNMVRYESPKIAGGLTFNALHTSNNGAELGLNAAEKVTSANVIWNQGPIWAGAAYQTQANTTGTEDPSSIRMAGRFDFGVGDAGAYYEIMKDLSGVSGRDQDVYGVFASFKFGGAFRVKGQYYKAEDVDGTAADDGGSMWAVGLDYDLGKKTRVYVNYASASNDGIAGAGGTYGVASGAGGHSATESLQTTVAGNDNKAFSVGMIIDF